MLGHVEGIGCCEGDDYEGANVKESDFSAHNYLRAAELERVVPL